MKFYEPFQRLDYAYIRREKDLLIYLRSSVNVYLPGGVILSNSVTGRNINWILDFYPGINNSIVNPYNFEKNELIFLSKTPLPQATDPRSLENAVRSELKGLLGDSGVFTVTCNVYNEKRSLEGQVTNTISQQGEVIII
jgi:hypothetical protein